MPNTTDLELSPFATLSSAETETVTGGWLGAIAGLASQILPIVGNAVGGNAKKWIDMAGGIAGTVAGAGGGGQQPQQQAQA